MISYLRETIGSQMPEEIKPSFFLAVEEGKFKVMPNHLFPAKPKLKRGAVLLGDSLNMRHPLTGGGMTVALTDVQSLGSKLIALNNFENADAVNEVVKSFIKRATRKMQP